MAIIVSHNNPIAPSTTSSGDELMNAYQHHAALLRGEADTQAPDSGFNPYAQQPTQQDAQAQHIANMEQYHAPIATKDYDIDSNYTDEKHAKFMKHMETHPLVQHMSDMTEKFFEPILAAKRAGKPVDDNDVLEMFADWGSSVLKPMVHEHYKNNPHKKGATFHDDIPDEVPDIVKKVRGKK